MFFILKDHLPKNAPDRDVIDICQQLEAVLISLNGDFADLTAYPSAKFKGIIALQIKNHPEIIPALMRRLLDYLTQNPDLEYYNGLLLIVEVHRIRLRK